MGGVSSALPNFFLASSKPIMEPCLGKVTRGTVLLSFDVGLTESPQRASARAAMAWMATSRREMSEKVAIVSEV